MRADQLESSFAEEDLRVPADTELNVHQQRTLTAKKANGTVGYVMQSVASPTREVSLPLCSALGLPSSRDTKILERVQQRATKTK